jgi:hypothetical protein
MDDQRLEEIARRQLQQSPYWGRMSSSTFHEEAVNLAVLACREALSSQEEELRQYFARIPHENIEQCPTYYDGCNCTTENVRGLMEQAGKLAKRAESAEAELLRLREGMTRTAAEMRHAYRQLAAGEVVNQRKFAEGLLAPQIARLERLVLPKGGESHVQMLGQVSDGLPGARPDTAGGVTHPAINTSGDQLAGQAPRKDE